MLEQRSIVVDHLGQIDAKLGRRSDAIREEAAAVLLSWQSNPTKGPIVAAEFWREV
ncbi:MAG TPA: hypothetical protein VFZ27_02970 [Terriglobia bacterium]|nr:hypothetical protein [Terriglobia bacterium]